MKEKGAKELVRKYSDRIVSITFDVFSSGDVSQEVLFSFTDGPDYGIVSVKGCFDIFLDAFYQELIAGELSDLFEVANTAGKPFGHFSVQFSNRAGCQYFIDQLNSQEKTTGEYFANDFVDLIKKVPEIFSIMFLEG